MVEHARALAGGGMAGVYLTDVEGECLLRLAGDPALPERLEAAGAVGPEFDAEGVVVLCGELAGRWPEGSIEPLWVMGRALGVIVTSKPGGAELGELARVVAPLFELASGFTDVFERGRRRKQPSTAAEMQLELLPPRIARVAGGQLVASVLPAYDVGGDWFDHAENPEGVWLAIGDAMGKGIRAAAMSAVSIGAFRSARREGADTRGCTREMHRATFDFSAEGFVTAIVAFWDPSSAVLTWTNCGHLSPLLARAGAVRELTAETTYPLGIIESERTFPSAAIQLEPGDRLLIYSDGIVEARLEDGNRFGQERLEQLLVASADRPPSVAVAAVERAILDATAGEIGDDATQLLLAID